MQKPHLHSCSDLACHAIGIITVHSHACSLLRYYVGERICVASELSAGLLEDARLYKVLSYYPARLRSDSGNLLCGIERLARKISDVCVCVLAQGQEAGLDGLD